MTVSNQVSEGIAAAIQNLQREIATLRTGRANPAMIEEISVECYGTRTPLQQLASISVPEPRLLVVQPWDPSVVKDIEKALASSSLGISPVVDGKIIRLPFPAMTEERRAALIKVVQEKAEQTRVRIRGAREEELKKLRQQERDSELSEDGLAVASQDVQEAIDQATVQVSQLVDDKTKEIMTV